MSNGLKENLEGVEFLVFICARSGGGIMEGDMGIKAVLISEIIVSVY